MMRWLRHRALAEMRSPRCPTNWTGACQREARRLERRLRDCPHCHEYLDQLRVTIEAMGRGQPDDLSTEVLDELVAVYRR